MKTLRLRKPFLYALVLLLKSLDIPSICYNHCNPETLYQQEFIRPSPVPTLYQIVPRRLFVHVSAVCDILTAELLGSQKYLVYSLLLPADAMSLENLLLVLMRRGHHDLCALALAHLSVFYAPLLTPAHASVVSYLLPAYTRSHETSHRTSLSITWFFYLNMFAQYSRYFFDLLYLLMVYILSIVPSEQRPEIILLFKPSNYKSYLLHIAESPLIHFYLMVFVVENYIQHLFRTSGTGNPNFINWCCVALAAIFLVERRWKSMNACLIK